MDQVLLRAEEVANAIGVGRATVYALIKRGELPAVRIGDSVRIPADALQKFVEKRLSVANSFPKAVQPG